MFHFTYFKSIQLKRHIMMFLILLFMICIILFSSTSYESAKDALMLWINNIIPSLLPFFICIELLKHTSFIKIIGRLLTPIMKPLFHVSRKWCLCRCHGNDFWLSHSEPKSQAISMKVVN